MVPGVEKAEDWEESRNGMLEDLSPLGSLELALAERVAVLAWRLHRVTRYETEAIAISQEKIEHEVAQDRKYSANVSEGIHPDDVRGNVKYTAARHRLLKRYPKLEDEKKLDTTDADNILRSALYSADVVDDGEADPEELQERVSIPGVPDDAQWEDFEGWTAGMVRAGLEAIANATNEDPEVLLEVATEDARREALRAKHRAEQLEREIEFRRRRCLLSDVGR